MSTTTLTTHSQPEREYEITDEQREALEHLAEHGEHTSEIATQLLELVS